MKISYCTTCHNRLWQLQQTLSHNLAFTIAGEVELCVLAYNDSEVEPYLTEHYAEYITDGRLKVKTHVEDVVFKDGSKWSCGPVKNLAHAMATGDIVFNLDADNFIDTAHEFLLKLQDHEVLVHMPPLAGTQGRIGVHKKHFDTVHGYRDDGRSDDGRFILRLKTQVKSLQLVYHTTGLLPVANSNT